MTAFERSRPVRAVRLSRLGTRRGCCKAEQPERRHGGDTAEKAAAGGNVGRMLIEIAHPVPPSHVAMDDHAISDETGQVLGAGPVELARVRNLYSELDTALASLKHIQEQIIEREFAPNEALLMSVAHKGLQIVTVLVGEAVLPGIGAHDS